MAPLIEVRDLHHAYPQNTRRDELRTPALAGISLDIASHSKLAIVGANGAGKSTLLWHLNGTLRPTAGSICYRQAPFDYSRRGLNRLRQHVALVMQEPDDQLFAGTIRQDVSFGPLNLGLSETEAAERVEEALAALEISKLADLPPHQLSHGQRKRAAIAGAMAMRPELLILDEPTAGLDPRGVDVLASQLDRLHDRGITIVFTTHDIDFVHRWASAVAVMQNGRLAKLGSPDTILGDAALMSDTGLRLPITLAIQSALSAPRNSVTAN